MMAKGSSPCRRLGRTSAGLYSQASKCGLPSAKALTDGNDNQKLDHSIKQALQRRSGKQFKAFVVMALDEDGNVVTHTTNHVQQCTDGIFASDAEQCLRFAHKTSVSQARSDQDLHDRSTLSNVVPNGICYENDLVRMGATQHKQEAFVSRPTSARTIGSTSGWPSEVESREASQTPSETRSSLSHSKRPAQLQYLLICEAPKIEDFLAKALRTMQQLAVKRIAKAWIKGICPKKQAMFPYNKKKREREGSSDDSVSQPGWWPDKSLCKFIEPDHIRRDERINLCLHLLRLTPTPAQLKEWNKGCVEPHQTHVTKGWTEFLRELAPPSIFDEMREPDDKTEERQKLLAQAYDLAKREEEYKNGDIDGDDRFWWHNEAIPKTVPKRKVRRSYDVSADESDVDSLAESAPPSKKSKRTSVATTPAASPIEDDGMQDCKPHVIAEPFTNFAAMNETLSRSASSASSQQPWAHDAKDPNLLMPMHEQAQVSQNAPNHPQSHSPGASWVGAPLPNTCHASTGSTAQTMPQAGFAIEPPTSTYPGRHDYQFPQQNLGHTPTGFRSPYVVETQVTQPQLATMTSSTMYTPSVMAQMVYAGQEQYNNSNAMYYGQPDNAQSQLFAVPGAANMNAQFNYVAPPNTPFSQCSSSQEPCYIVDPPTSYQYHPESGQPSYTFSGPRHSSTFQAPARVERGFTGHGSGVGGGAHT